MPMTDRWQVFKQWWSAEDDDAPITDASSADDYLVEESITKFQEASKEVTDITVALSSSRVQVDETLRILREAVTLAYSFSLDDRSEDVRNILKKVLDA